MFSVGKWNLVIIKKGLYISKNSMFRLEGEAKDPL